MSIAIRVAHNTDKEHWDAFVDNHPGSLPYQLFAWGKGVERAYGFRYHPILAEKGSEILGVFPLVELKKPLCTPKYYSLPYCDVGGFLARDQAIEKDLLGYASSELLQPRDVQICLRCDQEISLEGAPVALHSIETDKMRMVLELPDTSDALWQSFKSKLRSQVKKAVKNGLEFRFSSSGLDNFYSVYSRNMRDLGSPAHSRRWFAEIVRYYGQRAKIGGVFAGDVPVGGAIILCTEKTVSIPWASTVREYNKLGPNMLLYWKLLEYAADNNYDRFDFGRSSMDSGTFKFKAQWGAQPHPLHWYDTKSLPVGLSGSGKNSNRELASAIWRRFPVWFANFLGGRIRKYISL